jgi:hypothetical protein
MAEFQRTPRKDIDMEEVMRLYADGIPLAEIADRHATTHKTITDRLMRRGIRIRGRREALQIVWQPWEGKRAWLAEQMWADGCTFKEIGIATGASRSSVAGFVRRRGLHRFSIASATPNAETIAAMDEVDNGGGEIFNGPTADIVAAILAVPDEPQKIVAGSRVVWSAIGRETIKHFHNRKLPRDGVFIVEKVIEWEMSKTSVRICGFKSPMYLEEFELAAV